MARAIRERTRTHAAAQVVAAAVLFSTGGVAIKSAAVSGMQVASIRSGIAALALLLWLRGRVIWSGRVWVVGAVYAATLVLFVTATKLTSSANAIFLQSIAPLYSSSWRRSFSASTSAGVISGFSVLAVGGLALCLVQPTAPTSAAPDPVGGNLLGAICGITWAFTLLGLRWTEKRQPGTALSSVVAGNILAFLAGVSELWPLPETSAADWVVLGYLGLIQIGLAYILLTGAVRYLPTLQISLLLLIEPVLNPAWAWLLRGEHPGVWALTGGAVIVATSAAQATLNART